MATYQRKLGTQEVYDISGQAPRYISFDEAQKNNIWGQVQDVPTLDNRSPRNLDGLGGGESLTFDRGTQPDSYSIFNNALMEMLKKYQTLGTKPMQQQALDLSTQQAQRGMAEATPGMSPTQQNLIRSSSQSALNPSIQGAQDTSRTFSEQLGGFKDVLNTVQQTAAQMQDAQFKTQENTRKMIETAITQFGSTAFEGVNENELKTLEKSAGYPTGYLSRAAKSLKEKELQTKTEGATTDLKEYQYAISQGFKGSFLDWQAKMANLKVPKPSSTTVYMNTPQGQDAISNWSNLIISGQAKLSDIKTQEMRDAVAQKISGSGQVILDDKDREKLNVLDTAFNVANTIKSLSVKINTFDATGRISGYAQREAGAKLQTDPILAQYEAARKGFVANVARTLGEKGTLAEGDVQRAISNLPTIHDTKEVAEAKINTLMSILEGARTSVIQKSTEPLNKTTSGTLKEGQTSNGLKYKIK